jgi:hypothetical protein
MEMSTVESREKDREGHSGAKTQKTQKNSLEHRQSFVSDHR